MPGLRKFWALFPVLFMHFYPRSTKCKMHTQHSEQEPELRVSSLPPSQNSTYSGLLSFAPLSLLAAQCPSLNGRSGRYPQPCPSHSLVGSNHFGMPQTSSTASPSAILILFFCLIFCSSFCFLSFLLLYCLFPPGPLLPLLQRKAETPTLQAGPALW